MHRKIHLHRYGQYLSVFLHLCAKFTELWYLYIRPSLKRYGILFIQKHKYKTTYICLIATQTITANTDYYLICVKYKDRRSKQNK